MVNNTLVAGVHAPGWSRNGEGMAEAAGNPKDYDFYLPEGLVSQEPPRRVATSVAMRV